MNAAFVILASALLGNHPAAAPCNSPACSAPAPVATCSTCEPTCSPSFGHKLRGQLAGLFSCNTCKKEAPCETPCPAPCPAPAPVCATPAPCSTCGHGHSGGQLLGKLRGMFSHGSKCDTCSTCAAPATCDGGCSSAPAAAPAAAPAGAPAMTPAPAPATAPAAAPEAPKKMPVDAPKGDAPKVEAPKGDKAVRFEQTPEAPLAIPALNPVANTNPTVIVAPATLRNPF